MIFSKPLLPSSLPYDYDAVRPHHLLALYSSYHLLSSLLSSSRFLDKLKTHLSDHATVLLSKLSDLALPLLYSPLTSFLVPDALIRAAIRARCKHTLIDLRSSGAESDQERKMDIVEELKTMPIAVETKAANEQHYEVPARFYDLCLGPNKKYSCGLWPFPATKLGRVIEGGGLWGGKGLSYLESLEKSEVAMLDLYCARAGLEDGMSVVDLGCGWGSMTLHLAKRYPNCKITGISNSHSQREYILNTAKERGYNVGNINVITCDASKWEDEEYCAKMIGGVKDNDRVISIEMFEHMKNYNVLLSKVNGFLKPSGKLFVHIFTHLTHAYHFEKGWMANDRVISIEMFEHMKNYDVLLSKVNGFLKPSGKLFVHIFTHLTHAYHFEKGWMADTFFTGGTMPSDDLLLYFGEHFSVNRHWRVNGNNYEKTSNAWLGLMDEHWRGGALEPVLEEAYGKGRGREWYVNWRLFYLACAELFGFDNGEEWMVSHYLFDRR
eukprot:CAMPEP_0172573348 /NCGR_PEP_ID=MMETSP1067-20121228/136145_1 /TAXON_ID=265564 ORGANISM="Thalassiosira punctigera, Strain Tpunct2005C2" /NCGR_SAMPLE_ID=MMETSP1067 /ASSEMBLY_ACC=CAM_ASM_000444 /LENGTH=493 /DNA_ID=CAMNT_0013365951 /DNA_START=191 /DNA_END=1672 /DNA_ORIENTATION=-